MIPPKPFFKNGVSDFVGLKKDDTKPILYLSGTAGSWTEEEFIRITGTRYRCWSFAYIGKESPTYSSRNAESALWCMENGIRCFLDSGAHSFHNMRAKGSGATKKMNKDERAAYADKVMHEFLRKYAKFVRQEYKAKHKWDFYVTFDAEKRCPLIRQFTDELFGEGIYPVPVYHGDESASWFKRYLDDGHKILGVGVNRIGKTKPLDRRRYYETLFRLAEPYKCALHGFAVTGDIMFSYPWYSTDSTTWVKAAAYGNIIHFLPERQRLSLIHVSEKAIKGGYGAIEALPPSIVKGIRNAVSAKGFDFDKMRTSMRERSFFNAVSFNEAIAAHTKKQVAWAPWSNVIK